MVLWLLLSWMQNLQKSSRVSPALCNASFQVTDLKMAKVQAWAINDALQRIYALYGMLSLNYGLCNSNFVYICKDLKLH